MSDGDNKSGREGSLEAPTRHALAWQEPEFYDADALDKELERVFEICHGCRRCFNLCNSFPTLFDLIDESKTGELDGVDKKDYWQVVDHCYLCDMCYMTKCPYVPPHPWNVDFPHLMLRAKAVKNRRGDTRWRDKVLSSTDTVGTLAGIPVVAEVVNAVNRSAMGRKLLDAALGVHPAAPVPPYRLEHAAQAARASAAPAPVAAQAAGTTSGKVALFATCYGNRNEPEIGLDLVRIFEHNGIEVALPERESCCGMPKLELGDLQAVADLKAKNLPPLLAMIDARLRHRRADSLLRVDVQAGIAADVPGRTRTLPPSNGDIFDPFEYLAMRHKSGLLRTDFTRSLGKIAYHVACHLRVQNLGLKTRDVLQLIPGTTRRTDRTLFGSQRDVRGQTRISRHVHEDRQAGRRSACRRAARIFTPVIVRWRAIRSKAAWKTARRRRIR